MKQHIFFMIIISVMMLGFAESCSYPAPVTVTVTVTPERGQEQAIIPPATGPAPSSLPLQTNPVKNLVGSKQSNKYHLPSCEWAQKISPANEIWFSSPAEAKSRGYVPCKVCKPPS